MIWEAPWNTDTLIFPLLVITAHTSHSTVCQHAEQPRCIRRGEISAACLPQRPSMGRQSGRLWDQPFSHVSDPVRWQIFYRISWKGKVLCECLHTDTANYITCKTCQRIKCFIQKSCKVCQALLIHSKIVLKSMPTYKTLCTLKPLSLPFSFCHEKHQMSRNNTFPQTGYEVWRLPPD